MTTKCEIIGNVNKPQHRFKQGMYLRSDVWETVCVVIECPDGYSIVDITDGAILECEIDFGSYVNDYNDYTILEVETIKVVLK